jgi:hypothetical protein
MANRVTSRTERPKRSSVEDDLVQRNTPQDIVVLEGGLELHLECVRNSYGSSQRLGIRNGEVASEFSARQPSVSRRGLRQSLRFPCFDQLTGLVGDSRLQFSQFG